MSATTGIVASSIIIFFLILIMGMTFYRYNVSEYRQVPVSYQITIGISAFLLVGMVGVLAYFIEDKKKEKFRPSYGNCGRNIYNYCPNKLREFCQCKKCPCRDCFQYSTKWTL